MRVKGRQSLTLRLTLLFASASTAVLLVLGYLIGASVERHFADMDMEVLGSTVELARYALSKVNAEMDLELLPGQLEDSLIGQHDLSVVVLAPDGRTLFRTGKTTFPPDLIERGRRDGITRPLVWKSGKITLRGIAAVAATRIPQRPPMVVAIATDISHHQNFMVLFRKTLWIFVVVAATLAGILGWIAARRGLAPLHAMREGAAAVTANHLDYRLPVDTVPAELAELAQTLNEMLERLDDSFRRLSEFSSDLAHELRTPLSNLMTQTQVALGKTRTADEYREVLYSNAEEFERLARMVADMLFLAKSDNGLIVPSREPVDLGNEVRELFGFYDALAEDRGIELSLQGEGWASGDRLMLRRAISNLLSNAIRHTPRGGKVRIHIARRGNEATMLAVENTGEAIPVEHLPRLFDRFYRADPSRRNAGDGAGLGLAITRSIVRAHGGEIGVRSGQGVTRFEFLISKSISLEKTSRAHLWAASSTEPR